MKFDLTNSLGRELAAKHIWKSVDASCIRLYEEGFRAHLGASIVAHECDMYLYLTFRWAKKEAFVDSEGNPDDAQKARMYRLWQRGHREEAVWIKHLIEAGWRLRWECNQILHYHSESGSYFFKDEFDIGDGLVEDVSGIIGHEATAAAQGLKRRQLRIGEDDHFGGSIDCEGEHDDFPGITFLLEFKTYNTKQFSRLVQEGVALKSPMHTGQMDVYGKRRGYRFAIYCPINKNDDDIQAIQVVQLDWDNALRLEMRADFIINAKQPPERLSPTVAYWKCEHCSMKGPCHLGEAVAINCRSCRHSEPVAGKKWFCNRFNNVIPEDFIPKGCEEHYPILP